MIKFKKKTKAANVKVVSNSKIYKDYYEIIEKPDFVSAKQLMASTLVEINLAMTSKQKQEFDQKVKTAYQDKLDMAFGDFIITWNKNLRFSSTKNIPTLAEVESHNVESQNFFEDDEDRILNRLLVTYNKLIHKLLLVEKRYVEVTQGIIVYVSRETEQLKLAFSEISSDLNKE